MSPSFSFYLEAGSEIVSKTGTKCTYNGSKFCFPSGLIHIGCAGNNARGGIGGFVGPDDQYFLFCSNGNPEIAAARFNSKNNRWENYVCAPLDEKYLGNIVEEIWTSDDSNVLLLKAFLTEEAVDIFEKEFDRSTVELRLSSCEFRGILREEFLVNRKEKIVGDQDQVEDSDKADSFEEEENDAEFYSTLGSPSSYETGRSSSLSSEAGENTPSDVDTEEELSEVLSESECSNTSYSKSETRDRL